MPFPTTSILDVFTDTNGVDLPVHDANWSTLAGTSVLEVQDNAATGSVAAACSGYRNNANFGPDCEVFATIATLPANGAFTNLFIRLNETTFNGYSLVLSHLAGTDTIHISRVDAGVPTQLGAANNQELAAGDAVGMSCVGSTLQAYYKPSGGSWAPLGTTRTDATYSAAGRAGLYVDGAVIRVDDFGGGTVVLPPVVTVDPTEQTAAEGATANFTITATGATSYQWQQNDGAGAGWVNESGGSGGTTDTYTTPTTVRAMHSGRLYRCNAINAGGTTSSNAALLRVTAIPATYSGDGFVIGASYIGEGMIGAANIIANITGVANPIFQLGRH